MKYVSTPYTGGILGHNQICHLFNWVETTNKRLLQRCLASIDIRNGQTQATHVLETVAVGMLAKEERMKLNMVGCCTTDTLGFVEVMFYFYQ